LHKKNRELSFTGSKGLRLTYQSNNENSRLLVSVHAFIWIGFLTCRRFLEPKVALTLFFYVNFVLSRTVFLRHFANILLLNYLSAKVTLIFKRRNKSICSFFTTILLSGAKM